MKRVVAACGILILVTIICAISVGWLLSHPVQTAIGNPPADLNAEPVTFASDSGATVHGWWCPIQNANGAVLLLPGIRANRLSMVDRARSRWLFSFADRLSGNRRNRWRSHHVWLERESGCPGCDRFCSPGRPDNSSCDHRQFVGRRSCVSGNSATENRCACSRGSLPDD